MPRYQSDESEDEYVEEQQHVDSEKEEEEEEEEEQEEEDEEEEEEHAPGDSEEDDEDAQENAEESDEEGEEHWRYSTCEGNRKALLVGICYPGGAAPLSGCWNDARNMKQFLLERGYEEENMLCLTDEDADDAESMPTAENIVTGMRWLVDGAAPDDALFYFYSGHGSSVTDTDGDEADGQDECIVPCDASASGVITDDIIHALVVQPLPVGCRLTMLFDCCHSGSGADLPYMYTEAGEIKSPHDKAEQMASIQHHANANDEDALMKAVENLKFSQTFEAQLAHKITIATKTSFADVIFLSGCQDEQCSADALNHDTGERSGAVTDAMIKYLDEVDPAPTYLELLAGIREILAARPGIAQRPQLSSSHPMDLNLTFVC